MANLGGFLPEGHEGVLKCDDCQIRVEGILTDDMRGMLGKLHIRLSPFCPKVKDLPELKKMKKLTDQPSDTDAGPGKVTGETPIVVVQESGEDQYGFFFPEEKHTKYSTEDSRRLTFSNFESHEPADSFVDAGFFRNPPPRDKMTCFWCDGSLEYWEKGERPLVEHVKHYPGCGFVRQRKGTNFIYGEIKTMTAEEKQRARNLRYESNLEILYEFYPSYDDINTRTRSLIYKGFDESNAFLIAVDGLYYDPETKLIRCFTCGLRIRKCDDAAEVKKIHKQKAQKCLEIRDVAGIGLSPNDSVDYVICFPCQHVVKNIENGCCPERNCGRSVASTKAMKSYVHNVSVF